MNEIVSTYSLEELIEKFRLVVREEVISAIPKEDKLLSRKEAASFLRISLPTLHNWTTKPRIPSYRFEGTNRIYYKQSDLLKIKKQDIKKI